MIRLLTLSILSMFILGCGGKNASHLPSILELPGAIIGGAIENGIYNAKRKKVSTFVSKNIEALRSGNDTVIAKAIAVAKIPQKNHAFIKKELKNDKSMTFNPSLMLAEMATMKYTSLYTIKQEDKKINGFTYDAVYKIIYAQVEANPKEFYKAKSTIGKNIVEILMDKLQIKEHALRKEFSGYLYGNHHQLYVEPIVLLLMVNG